MAQRCPAEISADYTAQIRGRWDFARRLAMQFAIDNRLIEIKPAHTGSTDPLEQWNVIRCFGRYFEKWNKPETITADSGKTYIYNNV